MEINRFQFSIESILPTQFNDKRKSQFYTEFTALLNCGVDIRRTLELLAEEQSSEKLKFIYLNVLDQVIKGSSLSNAMQSHAVFTSFEYQSIRIGEETGRLIQIMEALSIYFDERVQLRRQLVSVFTYPVVVLSITFGVIYFMLGTVVPMFQDVFKQFGQELPPLTQTIVLLSANFKSFLIVFVLIISGIVALAYSQKNTESYKRILSTLQLKIPVFGPLFQKIYIARLCQSLTLLIEAKTPLLRALELAEQMVGFYPIQIALQEAKKEIAQGKQLHECFEKFTIFDKRFISLLKIAEEINQLDVTFNRLTKQYRQEVTHQTKLIGTILEPTIIVLIGGIVGVIMVAMYLPMFNLSNVIK